MERISAYFRNENEAESVKTKLHGLNVEDVLVDKVPEGNRTILDPIKDVFKGNEKDSDHQTHVLEFKVSESDLQEAKAIVKNNNGQFQ
ncbi:hypothetical protein [Sutcliffiella deserti]|uniref:hypothetical protein n=1 Tax=Sutcliffiella deserti TaxID=2875501 RepID=UPI001CC07AC7|nr:hypothetical protein [Sutcliffiella deserti]